MTECKNPKACTILLRGASKDILNEVERNLQDAMNSARNVMIEPLLVPGGGAVEMALTHVSHYGGLSADSNSLTDEKQCINVNVIDRSIIWKKPRYRTSLG